jgi:uncharacterized protein (TIGR02453 family)
MSYFSPDYLQFFKELSANNHKEWFDLNRKRYEREVKLPFNAFVSELIEAVHQKDPEIQLAPKDAIFRINRDIRFSKDKTPYKNRMSAIISPFGRKDKSYPGLYVEIGPEHLRVYGGLYMLSTQQIYHVRNAIVHNLDLFKSLYSAKKFRDHYGEIRGEQAKRLPKEFQGAAEKEPLVYNKNWYYFQNFDPKTAERDDLLDLVMESYVAGKPLLDFFKEAI